MPSPDTTVANGDTPAAPEQPPAYQMDDPAVDIVQLAAKVGQLTMRLESAHHHILQLVGERAALQAQVARLESDHAMAQDAGTEHTS